MTADELNRIGDDADRELDDYVGMRRLPDKLRGGVFIAVEVRKRRGLQPGFTDDLKAAVDRFAEK